MTPRNNKPLEFKIITPFLPTTQHFEIFAKITHENKMVLIGNFIHQHKLHYMYFMRKMIISGIIRGQIEIVERLVECQCPEPFGSNLRVNIFRCDDGYEMIVSEKCHDVDGAYAIVSEEKIKMKKKSFWKFWKKDHVDEIKGIASIFAC